LGASKFLFERGLLGHSDGDVLLHAIADALLGAAGQGDIGRLFADDDERHRGADSRSCCTVAERVSAAGWRIENIDATVVAERPKIAPHRAAIVAEIALACGIEADAVSVKGKTTEKLGFTGRGEGIAAYAVALLTAPD
jgi:2-C-methyl-D-erythritol 2,4-cyclodiphosphate synthase